MPYFKKNNDLTATHKITFFFNKYAKMERNYLCISLFFLHFLFGDLFMIRKLTIIMTKLNFQCLNSKVLPFPKKRKSRLVLTLLK